MGNVCNAVEDHCLQAMKIVHEHDNGRFDWLISGHLSREVISILSGKYKRSTFVHPVNYRTYTERRSASETNIEFALLSF